MTTVYFIRHCQPNLNNHDDFSRELSKKGLQDCQKIIHFFKTISIDYFYSSPYKRAIETIFPLANQQKKRITIINDFRERQISDHWIDDFESFNKKQWQDFSYHLKNGESLKQVQLRNISALKILLKKHPKQTLVIGSHGTALSTILNYYQKEFTLIDFKNIKNIMPFIVEMKFNKQLCLSIKLYNIFTDTFTILY